MNKKERILLKNQIAKAIFDDIEKLGKEEGLEQFTRIKQLKKKWLE